MKNTFSLLFLFIILITIGCNENGEKLLTPDVESNIAIDSTKTLNINDFNLLLSHRGLISNGMWNNVYVINLAGLWIGMDNNSAPRGNIVTTEAIPYSNYTSKWSNKQLGTYSLKAGVKYYTENWPVSYGAPVDASGFPKIYGDAMCWTSLQSDTTMKNQSIFASPINGLRVTEAVFGYQKDDLRNVIFIKYGITNLSPVNWNNLYIGFYSDTDLNAAGFNRTGYDQARSISYTYDTTANYTTGFSFLELPKNVGIKSHRIMRKNNYINPDYGEYSFTSPQQIIYALKGLSNFGQPMINPITGLETNFAFTGDPVTHTGWLDSPVDVRSMISSESFSLNSGETTWVTIVWVVTRETTLDNSLKSLKSQIDQIKLNTSYWQFH